MKKQNLYSTHNKYQVMKRQNIRKWIQSIWLLASILVTILYVSVYVVMTEYIGDAVTDNAVWGMYAGWVAIAGFPVVAFLILAAWFVKGGRKAVPIICAIICALIMALADFASWFSSYGS